MWGQFDIYWYILEAGGFCPFMPILIVGGANVRGGLCPTLTFQAGGRGGHFSLLQPLYLISPTPLLPSPIPFVSFLPPLHRIKV